MTIRFLNVRGRGKLFPHLVLHTTNRHFYKMQQNDTYAQTVKELEEETSPKCIMIVCSLMV